MSEFPKTILVGKIDGFGLYVGDIDALASLADLNHAHEVFVGRYKLVGTGKIHQYSDYVEDGEQE